MNKEEAEEWAKKQEAKPGTIWICGACGKKAKNRVPGNPGNDHGWDESCFLNAVLCKAEKGPDGKWVAVEEQPS